MKRLFLLISLVLGLFLSINGTLLAATRSPNASPLEWHYYIARNTSTYQDQVYRSQFEAGITQALLKNIPPNASNLSVSPNARYTQAIVYNAQNTFDLYLYDMRQKTWRNLTQTPLQNEFFVNWTDRHLFFNRIQDPNAALYRIAFDTLHSQRLTPYINDIKTNLLWTDDGKWIFWYSLQGYHTQLMAKHIDSPTPQMISDAVLSSETFLLSPDDAYLYFSRVEDGVLSIHRFSLSDGHQTPLTARPSTSQRLTSISPDSRWLYYQEYKIDGYHLYIVPTDGTSPPRHIAQNPALPFIVHPSPDDAWFLLSVGYQRGPLYLMRPDASEFKMLADTNTFHGWTADSRSLIVFDQPYFSLLSTSGHWLPILPQGSQDIVWVGLSGQYVLYFSTLGDYYGFHIPTQRHIRLSIDDHIILLITAQDLPTHPTPAKPLAAGLFIAMCSLIVAYKFQRRGLIKST